MFCPANTQPQGTLLEESLAKCPFTGKIPVLSRTSVRVSTSIRSEKSIKAVGKCRFTAKPRRAAGVASVELLSNRLQRTSDSEYGRIDSIASPLGNESHRKLAETLRRRDT